MTPRRQAVVNERPFYFQMSGFHAGAALYDWLSKKKKKKKGLKDPELRVNLFVTVMHKSGFKEALMLNKHLASSVSACSMLVVRGTNAGNGSSVLTVGRFILAKLYKRPNRTVFTLYATGEPLCDGNL